MFVACSCALAQLQLTDLRTGTVCGAAIELGTSAGTAAFQITNTSTTAVQLNTLQIVTQAGTLNITDGPMLGVWLVPRAAVQFTISYSAVATGYLWINSDSYQLVANGDPSTPVPPKFQIAVSPTALASGQQATLALQFDAVSAADGNGLLTWDFQADNRAGDTGMGFISPAGKSVPFTIAKGESTARFSGQPAIGFQTGSTAGTITFTATLGPEIETAVFRLLAAPVWIDSIRPTTGPGVITLDVAGFDNTRTASAMTFRFLDSGGHVIGGKPISADVSAAFQQYFAAAPAGGTFSLQAIFPVTGNVSQVDSVAVGFTNTAGTSSASVKISK
jgi:hypothetical protein